MLFALVSLAGMPPLAGFFGKFILLMAVIKSGYVWLALIAGVNIVISLYYYLMVAKRIYVDPLALFPDRCFSHYAITFGHCHYRDHCYRDLPRPIP